MEIRDLIYFCKVAETEHISKAAEQLGVSQPYLTKVIHRLEDELGCELFDHVGRSIRLNRYGTVLYESAVKISKELDLIRTTFKEMLDDPDRPISLVTGSSAYCSDIPLKYMAEYPGSMVTRQYMGRKEMIGAIEGEEADFCICSPPVSAAESTQIISRVLHKERACLLMPADHPLAAKDQVTIQDLQDLPLITTLSGSDTRNNIDILCAANGVRPSIIYESIDNNLIIKMVEDGAGCTIFAWNYVQLMPGSDKIVAREFSDQVGDIALCHNTNLHYTSAHKRFEAFVTKYFRDLE